MPKPRLALLASSLADRLFAIEALREGYNIEHFELPIQWSALRRASVDGALLIPCRALDAQIFCTKNLGELRPLWCAIWDPRGEVSNPTALLCIEHAQVYWGGQINSTDLATLVLAASQRQQRLVNRLGLSARLRRKFRL